MPWIVRMVPIQLRRRSNGAYQNRTPATKRCRRIWTTCAAWGWIAGRFRTAGLVSAPIQSGRTRPTR
ncbi:hypothetical protein LINPERHAP1_LOCUS9758 [Linum perenne]